jgi:hypothetical protein
MGYMVKAFRDPETGRVRGCPEGYELNARNHCKMKSGTKEYQKAMKEHSEGKI